VSLISSYLPHFVSLMVSYMEQLVSLKLSQIMHLFVQVFSINVD